MTNTSLRCKNLAGLTALDATLTVSYQIVRWEENSSQASCSVGETIHKLSLFLSLWPHCLECFMLFATLETLLFPIPVYVIF